MSDKDLVARLRRMVLDRNIDNATVVLLNEAADRIEHLESIAGAVSQGEPTDWERLRRKIAAGLKYGI